MIKYASEKSPAAGSRPARGATRGRTLRDSRAFTILEVTMAAFVMVMGLATTIAALQRGLMSLDTARNLTTASQVMQYEVEMLRIQNWDTVSAYSSTATSLALPAVFSGMPSVASRFSITRTATLVHSGMMEIQFTVSWKNYDGRTLSRSYVTYYAEDGLYDYVSK